MGLLDFIGSAISTGLTNAANERLMKEQQAYNERMMDKQNAYNSPAAQMERMKEAGMNPAALGMGENGTAAGGSSASALPTTLLPKQDYMTAASNSFLQMQQGISEKSLRQVRMDNIEAQTKQLLQDTELLGVNAESQRIYNQYAGDLYEWELQGRKANVKLTYAQRAEIKQSIREMKYRLENLLPQELKESISREKVNILSLEEMTTHIMSMKADTKLKESQNLTEMSQQGLNEAETAKTWQEEEQIRLLVENFSTTYAAEIKSLAARTHLTEKQAQMVIFNDIVKGIGTVGFVASQFTPMGKLGSGLGGAVTKGALSSGKPLSDAWY